MSKDCPKCKLINPDSSLRCDCGYDFPSGSMQGSYLSNKERKLLGGAWGALALLYLGWRIVAILLASYFPKNDLPLVMIISLGIAFVLFLLWRRRVSRDRDNS